jgi:pseudouridine-5'-phosphate glycosidase
VPPDSIHVAPEIRDALASGRAVVALESTLITHGLPYPANVETALAMEAAVRESGAVPATIAVLRGRITVGISADDIQRLAKLPAGRVRKCSRRDLPIAAALGEDASTTVAATLIVADLAGIRVFATGGIGGVHRGHPYDVSADLVELGRTPVAVVCSGAKAILDLPLTVEFLETQGVAILGFMTSTLPGFYTRSSGLPVDVTVQTPEEAARIISAARRLGTRQGILVAVPVPEKDALPGERVEKAVASALEEAEVRGIRGKAVTPFLLERVAELSGGDSRRANISLLINNARIAGLIASALGRIAGS